MDTNYGHISGDLPPCTGAGSVLETLGAGKSPLVVINDELMGNHQEELAKQLQKLHHLHYCTCRSALTLVCVCMYMYVCMCMYVRVCVSVCVCMYM